MLDSESVSVGGSRGLPHRGHASCMLKYNSEFFGKFCKSQRLLGGEVTTYVVEFWFKAATKGSLQLFIKKVAAENRHIC